MSIANVIMRLCDRRQGTRRWMNLIVYRTFGLVRMSLKDEVEYFGVKTEEAGVEKGLLGREGKDQM
jgi:hypothetical protein